MTMGDELNKTPESAKDFQMTSEIEAFEEKEVDREFLQSGFQEEIERARTKEAEWKEEHYGRAIFVAARSSELGLEMKIDDQLWQDMKEKGYDFKKEKNDAWGMTFVAGYLKEIDPVRFDELKDSFLGQKKSIAQELKERIGAAAKNPKRWKEYFAMAEHLINLEIDLLDLDELVIDDEVEDGLKQCLREHEKDPVSYLEIVNAIEVVSPGTYERIYTSKSDVKRMVEAAEEKADEVREKRDVWMYVLIKRNIRKVKKNILK